MIKAEVIAHEGYEVPNWVNKCKELITSGRVLAVVIVAILAGFGVAYWHGHQAAVSDQSPAQSQPISSSSLQVLTADELPTNAAQAPVTSPITTSPVGPASTGSLSQLQSTGVTQNNVGGLSQAMNTIQSTVGASSDALTQMLNR